MRWEDGDESENVEDRRGQSDDGGGGGGGGLAFRPTHISIGGIIVLLVVSLILGVNPLRLVGLIDNGNGPPPRSQPQTAPAPGKEDRAHKLVATILRYTEKVWDKEFRAMGRTYEKPHLVMFS